MGKSKGGKRNLQDFLIQSTDIIYLLYWTCVIYVMYSEIFFIEMNQYFMKMLKLFYQKKKSNEFKCLLNQFMLLIKKLILMKQVIHSSPYYQKGSVLTNINEKHRFIQREALHFVFFFPAGYCEIYYLLLKGEIINNLKNR